MWVLCLFIYWCDCWYCFLLNICWLDIDPWGEKTKNGMHINHCVSTCSVKAIPIQEVQKLLCVDAAASDDENLCIWCLDSLVDIFGEILFQNLWNNFARLIKNSLLNNVSIRDWILLVCFSWRYEATEVPRVNFVMREALFEIYTWILCRFIPSWETNK